MAVAKEGESLAALKKQGMKVNEIDTAPLQKAALAAQDDLAKDVGAEPLLAIIRKQ
jgi:TRAP-type C4-dicarboxylate transport system substrate-binding protein